MDYTSKATMENYHASANGEEYFLGLNNILKHAA